MFFKDNLCHFNKFKEFNIKKIKNKRFSMNIMEIEDWMVVPSTFKSIIFLLSFIRWPLERDHWYVICWSILTSISAPCTRSFFLWKSLHKKLATPDFFITFGVLHGLFDMILSWTDLIISVCGRKASYLG